jgi:Family of unknown function (DUF6064)
MQLPFTVDQFLEVFQRYNLAVWPVQWILGMLGLVAVSLALSQRRNASRWVSGILALMWFWMAAAYSPGVFRDHQPNGHRDDRGGYR